MKQTYFFSTYTDITKDTYTRSQFQVMISLKSPDIYCHNMPAHADIHFYTLKVIQEGIKSEYAEISDFIQS